MSDQSNVPMTSAGPEPFYQVWLKALTRPNEQTFVDLAASPNAKAGTAYLWYFIASIVQFIMASLVQGAILRQLMQEFAPSEARQFGGGFGSTLIGAICGAPVAAVVSTIFFAIGVAIVQWIARMFGGRGTTDKLAYTLASVAAPALILGGLLTLLGAIPYVGLCFSAISVGLGFYVLYLEVAAVKGVNQFGWGAAAGSLFIPGLVIAFVCGCLVIGGLALMGPAIGDVLSQINQSLQSVP